VIGNKVRPFKVGLIGPTQVGKTSLVTSLLTDGQRLLENGPVTLNAADAATRSKIAQHRNDLSGSMLAGEFVPGALRGTEDSFLFKLLVDPGVSGAGIMLEILDFPGGWLDDLRRPPEAESRWTQCLEHIKQSSVLLAPIDASILMGAQTAAEMRAIPSILTVATLVDVARDWATERAVRNDEPGLLVLCPVKCESYFADNGGRRDASAQLLQMVRKVYREVIEAVHGEAPEVLIRYCPVDTIGCVEVQRVEWQPDSTEPGGHRVSVSYLVRPPGQIRVKGIDDVFVSLCQLITDVARRVQERTAADTQAEAEYLSELAARREGLWRDFTLWFSGERQRRRDAATGREINARTEWGRLEAFDRVMKDLANRDFGKRTESL
jgi:hypothetical protein